MNKFKLFFKPKLVLVYQKQNKKDLILLGKCSLQTYRTNNIKGLRGLVVRYEPGFRNSLDTVKEYAQSCSVTVRKKNCKTIKKNSNIELLVLAQWPLSYFISW